MPIFIEWVDILCRSIMLMKNNLSLGQTLNVIIDEPLGQRVICVFFSNFKNKTYIDYLF